MLKRCKAAGNYSGDSTASIPVLIMFSHFILSWHEDTVWKFTIKKMLFLKEWSSDNDIELLYLSCFAPFFWLPWGLQSLLEEPGVWDFLLSPSSPWSNPSSPDKSLCISQYRGDFQTGACDDVPALAHQ